MPASSQSPSFGTSSDLDEDAGRAGSQPVVGMGATRLDWSDKTPFTVVEVVNPKTVRVRQDKATWRPEKGGYFYEHAADEETITVTERKGGAWYERGKEHNRFVFGYRRMHLSQEF